jgi:hypothetical protein
MCEVWKVLGVKHWHPNKTQSNFGFRRWCRPCTTKQSIAYGKTLAGRERTRRAAQQPKRKLACAVRNRLKIALKNALTHKRVSLSKSVGTSTCGLLQHIEAQLRPGMTIENRGTVWDIDHIIHVCAFDLSDEMQQAAVNYYINLQPMLRGDNIRKGGKHCRLLKEAYLAWYGKVIWTGAQ